MAHLSLFSDAWQAESKRLFLATYCQKTTSAN
ncbi:hypothetical protein N008_00650 [Hymenobacter sp. APR13]|nr:hypothetical protein N008_00650 [Hymenobacter sp. APR13]